MNILDILAQKKIIKNEDIQLIEKEAKKNASGVDSVLIKRGVRAEDILNAKGELFDIPVRDINQKDIGGSVLEKIPEDTATYYGFVPIGFKDGVLEIGLTDPDNLTAREAISFVTSKTATPYKIFLISEEDYTAVLELYKGFSGQVKKALSQFETDVENKLDVEIESGGEVEGEDTLEGSVGSMSKNTKVIDDAPVIKIVSTILRYATDGNASDIHIERLSENVRVRFRVDGVMHTSLVLPASVHPAVVSRIKILANMRLDEKRKPQDGRITAKIENRKVDFRVSTFPAYYGEKIVMRILDQDKGIKNLDNLGLSKKNIEIIRNAIKRPYGLILVSGPTGSGKTTTLYAMLNELEKEKSNVLSLEDPIEYSIDGISQSQVRPEIGYTFANGLRTTLRQDPDIIMVGEIRDKETAQLAIQAALTGHLVISTIHTNNALGVIPRLIDMGVDPYLIAPTLILAIAQRLVRVLCPGGGKPVPIEGSIKLMFEKQFADLPREYRNEIVFKENVFEIQPTEDCPNGTRGRVAVMEVLSMDKDIEKVILSDPNEISLAAVARTKGMITMKEDAIMKAFEGIVPFEDVNTL